MEGTRNQLVILGMTTLFTEIAASALSIHGWKVLDAQQARLQPSQDLEILLVACPLVGSEVIACIRQAQSDFPSGKVVLLGVDAKDADLIRFIEEGARAFVPADKGMSELLSILEMVRKNETACSGALAQLVIGTIHRLSQEQNIRADNPLTQREKEILQLVRNGLSNKEIAAQLHITSNTVKNHVHHLLEKLKVRNRHDAAWVQIRRPARAASLAPVARNGTDA